MLIGYARVSTADQTLALQQDALNKAGCDSVYTDTASGASTERSGLYQALSHLRNGDTLVVWRLDRLGRSLQHLIQTVTAPEHDLAPGRFRDSFPYFFVNSSVAIARNFITRPSVCLLNLSNKVLSSICF